MELANITSKVTVFLPTPGSIKNKLREVAPTEDYSTTPHGFVVMTSESAMSRWVHQGGLLISSIEKCDVGAMPGAMSHTMRVSWVSPGTFKTH